MFEYMVRRVAGPDLDDLAEFFALKNKRRKRDQINNPDTTGCEITCERKRTYPYPGLLWLIIG